MNRIFTPEEELTDEVIEGLRRIGDEEADNVMREIFEQNNPSEAEIDRRVDDFFKNLARPGALSEDHPFAQDPKIRKLIDDHAEIIKKSDQKLIQLGHEFFKTHGLMAFMVLGFASLPELYLGETAAYVLGQTNRLETDKIHLRLLETGHMVLQVMEEGNLSDPTKNGAVIVLKVRLMHAAIRYLIQRPPPEQPEQDSPMATTNRLRHLFWPGEKFGTPIDQIEMAYTIMTFSYVILRGLRDLGIPVPEEQQNAYIYTWQRIGRALGINRNDHLLPDNFQDCEALFERLKKKGQIDPADPEQSDSVKGSRKLTHDLLAYLRERIPGVFFAWLLKRMPRVGMRILLSEDTANRLGLTWPGGVRAWVARVFFEGIRWVNFHAQIIWKIFPLFRMFWQYISKLILKDLWKLPKGHIAFEVPTKLAENWKM